MNGRKEAFAIIIRNTEGLVAQIVFQMIQYPEDRKDIAQDIYMKVFNNLGGFQFKSKLSTWIAQIAYYTCISFVEKKKLVLVGNWQSEDGNGEETLDEMIHQSSVNCQRSTENLLILKERKAIIQSAIATLPPIYKTLITLYHQEDMSYDEITQITGLPGGTVKSYLFRARKSLKDLLLIKYQKEVL